MRYILFETHSKDHDVLNMFKLNIDCVEIQLHLHLLKRKFFYSFQM
jgi:hypothetical protein